jgi:hypothetical protein
LRRRVLVLCIGVSSKIAPWNTMTSGRFQHDRANDKTSFGVES